MVSTIPDIFAKSKAGEVAREFFTLHGLPNRRNEDFHYTDLSRFLDKAEAPSTEFLEYPAPKSELEIRILETRIAVYCKNSKIEIIDDFALKNESVFAKLLCGMAIDAKTIKIPDNCEIDISLIRFSGSRASIHLEIGENSRVRLFEKQEGAGGLSSLYFSVIMSSNSQLEFVSEIGECKITDLSQIFIDLGKMTAFDGILTSKGGKMLRRNIEVSMNGENAKANLKGVYVLNKNHFDFSSNIIHNAPNCESHTILRGIANDSAQAIFQGKITVAKGAKKTIGNMEHRGIMIEDGARIFAKPNLEIYNDDVECSHANTIGAIDESALFYMQSRGISKPRARTMLTHAFLSSVFDDLENADDLNVNLENMLEGMLNV